MKHLSVILLLLIVTGCASTHPGFKAQSLEGSSEMDLTISVQKVSNYSDRHHDFIDFTFENSGSSWLRIVDVGFSCGDECDQKIDFYVGDDLIHWANALERRREISRHNKDVFLTTLVLGGMATAQASSDKTTSNIGAATALGALGYAGVSSLSAHVEGIQTSDYVPETHLLSDAPIHIPAGMFDRRWILIHSPRNLTIEEVEITVETIDGVSETFHVSLNASNYVARAK